MHFCQRCGIELISESSKTQLCKHCQKKEKESFLTTQNNNKIITDAKHAKAFGITYGEYSRLRESVVEMIRKVKC